MSNLPFPLLATLFCMTYLFTVSNFIKLAMERTGLEPQPSEIHPVALEVVIIISSVLLPFIVVFKIGKSIRNSFKK